MKITQEEEVDRQTVLHIELEDEDLDPYLDRGYRRVSQRTAIPGFRKGIAPRRIIEQFLGREVLLNEVLDTMLPEVTGRAIDEQSIDAVGLPQIELLDLGSGRLSGRSANFGDTGAGRRKLQARVAWASAGGMGKP